MLTKLTRDCKRQFQFQLKIKMWILTHNMWIKSDPNFLNTHYIIYLKKIIKKWQYTFLRQLNLRLVLFMHKYQASNNNNREMPPLPTWLWARDIFCLRQGQLPFWNIWWITMTDDYRNKHSWHHICFHPEHLTFRLTTKITGIFIFSVFLSFIKIPIFTTMVPRATPRGTITERLKITLQNILLHRSWPVEWSSHPHPECWIPVNLQATTENSSLSTLLDFIIKSFPC